MRIMCTAFTSAAKKNLDLIDDVEKLVLPAAANKGLFQNGPTCRLQCVKRACPDNRRFLSDLGDALY